MLQGLGGCGDVLDGPRDELGVGARLLHALLGPADLRSGDELHGARDLPSGLHPAAPAPRFPKLRSHSLLLLLGLGRDPPLQLLLLLVLELVGLRLLRRGLLPRGTEPLLELIRGLPQLLLQLLGQSSLFPNLLPDLLVSLVQVLVELGLEPADVPHRDVVTDAARPHPYF